MSSTIKHITYVLAFNQYVSWMLPEQGHRVPMPIATLLVWLATSVLVRVDASAKIPAMTRTKPRQKVLLLPQIGVLVGARLSVVTTQQARPPWTRDANAEATGQMALQLQAMLVVDQTTEAPAEATASDAETRMVMQGDAARGKENEGNAVRASENKDCVATAIVASRTSSMNAGARTFCSRVDGRNDNGADHGRCPPGCYCHHECAG
jgi:hypothetical protein